MRDYENVGDIEQVADDANRWFDDSGHWRVTPGEWAGHPDGLYEQQEFMEVLYKCISKLPDRLADFAEP